MQLAAIPFLKVDACFVFFLGKGSGPDITLSFTLVCELCVVMIPTV